MYWRLLQLVGLTLGLAGTAWAGQEDLELRRTDTRNDDLDSPFRFQAVGDNYFVWNRMNNRGWAGRDENALRGHFTLRFLVQGRPTYRLYLGYTGEFDFYLNTRASGPVVNRLNNPAGLVQLPLAAWITNWPGPRDHLELGLEHESNGQVQEVGARNSENAILAYQTQDRAFFDRVSRGADFVSLAMHRELDLGAWPVTINAKVRLYFDQDYAVTWGPEANRGIALSDYHRLRLEVRSQSKYFQPSVQWTVGDKLFKTDSFVLGLTARLPIRKSIADYLPIYVRYHRGPLNTLSNYSQRQDSWGVGLDFTQPFH